MKKLVFIGLSGAIVGMIVFYYLVASDITNVVSLSAGSITLSGVVGILLAFAIRFSSKTLDNYLPWYKHEANRLVSGLLIDYIIVLIISIGSFYIYFLIIDEFENFVGYFGSICIKLAILMFLVILIFEIGYFALYSYYSYTTFQISSVKQKRKQIELQLRALKSQLSPHFLFNSLNTISSLLYKDQDKAERFIRKLAKMYDYTLGSYDVKLISLREELDFVNSYKYLLQTRFENKLSCSIQIDEDYLETRIPPLTLQMLIENAVKHNVMDEENPLLISVKSENNEIVVENNITRKPQKVTSFQIGLKNINARYVLLFKKGISITNGNKFTVKLPVIA